MLNRSDLAIAVGHADVSLHHAFYSAAHYFHISERGPELLRHVHSIAAIDQPRMFAKNSFVVVEGDVVADVDLLRGCTMIVFGDVHSTVQAANLGSIVIAGNVQESATIYSDEIVSLFVGGNVLGRLRSCGSIKAWVEGDLTGQLFTGSPTTQLRVKQNCTATISPSEKGALFYLTVDGFMDFESLGATAAKGYTQFHASIGKSNRPPGIYPVTNELNDAQKYRIESRWVIRESV